MYSKMLGIMLNFFSPFNCPLNFGGKIASDSRIKHKSCRMLIKFQRVTKLRVNAEIENDPTVVA